MRQRSEGLSRGAGGGGRKERESEREGGGVSKGVRDAVERDLAVREIGGGEEKKSDGDGCAIVLDAVERRRGSEVKRGESEERSGFRGGDAHQGGKKKIK